MAIRNALAGVAVRNASSSVEWYEQLIGHSGTTPMPGVWEWTLPSGGVLQLFEDAKRAGSSSVTFSVTDLGDHVAQLANRGVRIGERTTSKDVSTASIEDPDGNQVVLAEPHSERVAR